MIRNRLACLPVFSRGGLAPWFDRANALGVSLFGLYEVFDRVLDDAAVA